MGKELKMDLRSKAALEAVFAGRAALYVLNPQKGWVRPDSARAARYAYENNTDAAWIYGAILQCPTCCDTTLGPVIGNMRCCSACNNVWQLEDLDPKAPGIRVHGERV